MSRLVPFPITQINGVEVSRTEQLDVAKIKLISSFDGAGLLINYYEPSRQKNFEYVTSLTFSQIYTLVNSIITSQAVHGLMFVFIKSIDGTPYNRYAFINELSIVTRLPIAGDSNTRVWYDLGDSDHADQKELELYYVNDYYYTDDPGGTPDFDVAVEAEDYGVTAAIDTEGLCWESGETTAFTVTVDRGTFTGTLHVSVTENENLEADSTTVANPGTSASLNMICKSGTFNAHPAEVLQIIIRDTDSSGEILYSFRKTNFTACPL